MLRRTKATESLNYCTSGRWRIEGLTWPVGCGGRPTALESMRKNGWESITNHGRARGIRAQMEIYCQLLEEWAQPGQRWTRAMASMI
jgi:hypothetical protein